MNYFISFFLILLVIALVYMSKNLENFVIYSPGTRLCNNRGCDIRYVKDMGTYYCRHKPKKN